MNPGLGRLGELADWWTACHGPAAPGDGPGPRRARLVLFGPLPQDGVGTELAALAEVAGVGVRHVDPTDTAYPTDTADPTAGAAGSAPGGHEAAARADAAVRRGRAVADEEVDAGADLLVGAEASPAAGVAASTLVAALTGREPTAVTGVPTGADGRLDDAAWMRRVPAVRDLLRRVRPAGRDPLALLAHAEAPDLAALTGFLAQAAVRRTPVVLDGAPSLAAALLASALEPGARDWWLAGSRCGEPAAGHALDVLGLDPLLDLGVWAGGGAGALPAVGLLRAALAAARG